MAMAVYHHAIHRMRFGSIPITRCSVIVRRIQLNVLLIGGTGAIGIWVVQQLVERGEAVTVFHRGEHEPPLPPAVRHVHHPDASIPVRNFPRELFTPAPDVVIHMNAMGEADARAAAKAFRGRTGRMVWLSSGDVYRAYGCLTRIEPGTPEPGLLTEDSPLRSVLYPYRRKANSPDSLDFMYEKILVEQAALSSAAPPGVILRLPKVYGPGGNADLATVYRFRHHPSWRWTHGYVENVAAAIVLAAFHPRANRRIYNVGEEYTPTVAERLARLPESEIAADLSIDFDFAQDVAYDTGRIRDELGYREPVSYEEGLRRTFGAQAYS
jgi:nucleoside-diphosphate-sugar epimerase